ncbi:MAG: SGNH/GDSL hydrolase family protein [Kiritimatiellae bacterium]|nr:SGNH/GDSL hydrolase family protein [Kiritimatiellia bacterium]
MKKTVVLAVAAFAGSLFAIEAPKAVPEQWKGLRVGVLGDSITDKSQCAYQKLYWQYLAGWLSWDVHVYGISGHQWCHIPGQAEVMISEMGDDLDAVFIFAGTNDYCGAVPLGEWYETKEETVNWWGEERRLMRRSFSMDQGTLRGRMNFTLSMLKKRYPKAAVVLLTPLHRAYATFGGNNIQPAEDFPNTIGLYVDDYVKAIREAADVWGVEVVDLYGASGMIPLQDEYARYFRDSQGTDRLHPNQSGHLRIADLVFCRLSSIPSSFRED